MTPPVIEPCTFKMQICESRSVPRTPSAAIHLRAYALYSPCNSHQASLSIRSLNNAWSFGRQRSASSSVFTAAIILPASRTPPTTRRSRVLREPRKRLTHTGQAAEGGAKCAGCMFHFYGARRLITALTTACHLSLS